MKKLPLAPLSEGWFAYRRARITGTDVPGILGLSSYKTPLSVWMEKTGQQEGERETTDLMNWGHHMEASCRSWTEEETGVAITPNDGILQHDDLPWLCCTPDGTLTDKSWGAGENVGTWEGKCPSPWRKADWVDGMPKAYQVQVLTSLAVTGYTRGILSALFHPELRWGWVEYDKALIENIIERCQDFWDNHVQKDIPPEATSNDTALLKDLHPEDTGEIVTFDNHDMIAASDRATFLMGQKKALDKEINALRNRIRQAMGPASYAALPDGTAWSHLRNAKGTRVLTHINRIPRNAERTG